jgi:hypothetical protein
MLESVPTKVIAPAAIGALRAIVAAKSRTHSAAAVICSEERNDRIADIVIEPLELRV